MSAIGWFGTISRDDGATRLATLVDEPTLRRAADAMIADARRLFAGGPRGSRVIEGGSQADPVDEHVVGAACAAAAMASGNGDDDAMMAAGLAVHVMTGSRHFTILARRHPSGGTVTELETMAEAADEAEARAMLMRHPALMGMAMAKMFAEAAKAAKEGGREPT